MPEEQNQEEQQPRGNAGPAQAHSNGAATPDELALIKAELEEERIASAAVTAALAEREARISQLERNLSDLRHGSESLASELTQLKDAHAKAVAKYLEAARLANPAIPGDVIAGNTVEEIDASVKKAQSIAESVRRSLESQGKEAKVPAGAPTRSGISTDALSPRGKIALGLQQKQT